MEKTYRKNVCTACGSPVNKQGKCIMPGCHGHSDPSIHPGPLPSLKTVAYPPDMKLPSSTEPPPVDDAEDDAPDLLVAELPPDESDQLEIDVALENLEEDHLLPPSQKDAQAAEPAPSSPLSTKEED